MEVYDYTKKIFACFYCVEHRIWHHSKSSSFNLCQSGSEVRKFPTHACQISLPHQKSLLHLLVCIQSLEKLFVLNQNGYHTRHSKWQSCRRRTRRAGRDEKHT